MRDAFSFGWWEGVMHDSVIQVETTHDPANKFFCFHHLANIIIITVYVHNVMESITKCLICNSLLYREILLMQCWNTHIGCRISIATVVLQWKKNYLIMPLPNCEIYWAYVYYSKCLLPDHEENGVASYRCVMRRCSCMCRNSQLSLENSCEWYIFATIQERNVIDNGAFNETDGTFNEIEATSPMHEEEESHVEGIRLIFMINLPWSNCKWLASCIAIYDESLTNLVVISNDYH